MADPSAVISAVASVVSAVGGAFAAVAAFRSAASAREAREETQTSEKRAALRQLMVTANEVLVEGRRAESRGAELKLAYRTLFIFSGSSGGSSEGLYLDEVDKRLAEVTKLSEYAKPFTSGQDGLINGPLDEISNRETKIAQVLTQVRAIREDLEREHGSVKEKCAIHREKATYGKERVSC